MPPLLVAAPLGSWQFIPSRTSGLPGGSAVQRARPDG